MDLHQSQTPASPGGNGGTNNATTRNQLTAATMAAAALAAAANVSSPMSASSPTSAAASNSSSSRRTRLTEKMSRMHKRRGTGGGGGGTGGGTGSSNNSVVSSPGGGAGAGVTSATASPHRRSSHTKNTATGVASPTAAGVHVGGGGGVSVNTTTPTNNNNNGSSNTEFNFSSQGSLSPSVGSSTGGNKANNSRPRRFARKLSDLSSSRDANNANGGGGSSNSLNSSNNNNNNGSNSSISLGGGGMQASRGIQSSNNNNSNNKDSAEETATTTTNSNSTTKPTYSPPRPFGPMSSLNQPSSPKITVSSDGSNSNNAESKSKNDNVTASSSATAATNTTAAAAASLATAAAAAAANSTITSENGPLLSPLQKTDSLTKPRVDAILTEVSSCTSDVSSPGALANHRYHSSSGSNHGRDRRGRRHNKSVRHTASATSLSEEADDDDDDESNSEDDDESNSEDDDESQSQEDSDGESQDDDDDDESQDDDDEDSYEGEEVEEEEEDESCANSPKTTTSAETPPRRGVRNMSIATTSATTSPSKMSSISNSQQLSPTTSQSYNNNNMDLIRNALLTPPSLLSTTSGASTACMHNHSSGQQQPQQAHLNKTDSSSSVGVAAAGALSPSNGGNGGGGASTPDRKGRNRVPGGAAAKLILLRPQNSDEDKEDDGDRKTRGGGGGGNNSNEDLLRACAAGAFLDGTRQQQQAYNNINADYDDDDDKEQDVSEINVSMNRAKTEFAIGSAANRRYYKAHDDAEDTKSQRNYYGGGGDSDTASMAPSIFNRTEVFHQTAAAAVTALLTPRHLLASHYGGGGGTTTGSVMGGGCDAVSVLSLPPNLSEVQPNYSMGQMSVTSAFQTPKEPGQDSLAYESLARRAVSPHLISETVESKLNKMSDMMHDPNKTLADLLTAINSPEDNAYGSSQSSCGSHDSRRGKEVGPGANNNSKNQSGGDSYTSDNVDEKPRQDNMDIGYLVRRKNACGALQVLTAPVKNRVKIGWTVGVLPALTSVLRDTGDEGVTVTFPDKRRRREFEAARNRAVACLMNLSMPKENRIAVFHTPNLVHWLVVIIMEGQGFPRKGCCAILAFLSKSVENRKLMVHVPDLIEAATRVIKARPPRMESQSGQEEKADGFGARKDDDASDVSNDDASKHDVSKKASAVSDQQSRLQSVGSSFSNESDDTPRLGGGNSPVEISGYDETADELLRGSRQNIFAMLGHLVKEKDNAYHLVRHANLIAALSEITSFQSSPSHILAVQMLACLSRHRLNTKVMVFKYRMVVPALVEATQSASDETRLYACFALQNLAQDKSCRQELAVSPGLVTCLCDRSREATVSAERLAAISALKNLCDEPANLIPMTNTPDCIATLMHLAHGKEPGIDETMQYRACDALATLSHWLRKIATSGQCMENGKLTTPHASNTSSTRRELNVPKNTNVFVPSLRVVTWNQWE